MAATINAFPPLHAFNSSRSWFLALITLLHVGVLWMLATGYSIELPVVPKGKMIIVDELVTPPEPPPRPDKPVVVESVFVPKPVVPVLAPIEDTSAIQQRVTEERPPPVIKQQDAPGSGPVLVEPRIDARRGLTEPVYPPSAIRQNQAGTVVLSVEVLPNGRVGDVRIERSSGYPALDESAVREARRWRLIPGTRDGTAVPMWKQVPITFQLKD
jgi:periplasmic protein TonB